jgi:hypothetical protein
MTEKPVPLNPTNKPAYILSVIILLLMTAASVAGIFTEDIYRDNHLVTSGWYGNDWVTLLLAVPLLAISMVLSSRGSQAAQLFWMGMLFYALYNYAFYLFGAAYNSLFLVYVALLTLSGFALIFGLSGLNTKAVAARFKARTPTKGIAGFMTVVSLLLGVFHIGLSLNHLFTGQIPEFVTIMDKTTNIISALDLSITVSVGLLGALWLWRRKPWGYVLAAIWNVKGAVYLTALSAATLTAFQSGASESPAELALWIPIALGCAISLILLLQNMGSVDSGQSAVRSDAVC